MAHEMFDWMFEWFTVVWFEYIHFNILIDSTDDRLGLAIFRTAFTTSIFEYE